MKRHIPNRVPRSHRIANVVLAVVLLTYGVIGLSFDRVDLFGRRVRIAVFEAGAAWLMAAALVTGAAVLLSVVVDHYDTRDNEKYYSAFRWTATHLGWCLVASALIAHLIIGFTR